MSKKIRITAANHISIAIWIVYWMISINISRIFQTQTITFLRKFCPMVKKLSKLLRLAQLPTDSYSQIVIEKEQASRINDLPENTSDTLLLLVRPYVYSLSSLLMQRLSSLRQRFIVLAYFFQVIEASFDFGSWIKRATRLERRAIFFARCHPFGRSQRAWRCFLSANCLF